METESSLSLFSSLWKSAISRFNVIRWCLLLSFLFSFIGSRTQWEYFLPRTPTLTYCKSSLLQSGSTYHVNPTASLASLRCMSYVFSLRTCTGKAIYWTTGYNANTAFIHSFIHICLLNMRDCCESMQQCRQLFTFSTRLSGRSKCCKSTILCNLLGFHKKNNLLNQLE